MLSIIWRDLSKVKFTLLAPFASIVIAVLILSTPLTGLANDHNKRSKQNGGQASQFQSIDDATSYVREQHPGAKIVKVVRKKQADGSHVALFRILTADGRMKKISVSVD